MALDSGLAKDRWYVQTPLRGTQFELRLTPLLLRYLVRYRTVVQHGKMDLRRKGSERNVNALK